MIRHSVQLRDRIFVKGYGFSSFAKNMCKMICKNASKNLSGKYGPVMLGARHKPLNLHQMHLKLLQKESFKKQQKKF